MILMKRMSRGISERSSEVGYSIMQVLAAED